MIDATALQLISIDPDDYPNLCYADCPDWHGCDCPNSLPR